MKMRIHHVALAITDIDRARHFYGVVLGLREIGRPDFTFPGVWYAAGDAQLHLLVNEHARTLRGATDIDSHDGHIALEVPSYERMLARLERYGIEHHARPVSHVPWARIFVQDPDGNVIELVLTEA